MHNACACSVVDVQFVYVVVYMHSVMMTLFWCLCVCML